MSPEPDNKIRIAVVGHTNTGKTSLLRTLARDTSFGDVADTPATTRQVEGIALLVEDQARVELFDTPGLENAGALYEALEAVGGPRHSGPERIRRLLDNDHREFEQEARVLAQVMESDGVIYVIDAREPVLGKYQDELAILALCARPVLPVLNFVAADHYRSDEWRQALARVNLHTVAAFDMVVFSLDAELRLWDRLRALLDKHEDLLQALIAERRTQADWRRQAAARRAAGFLVDVAACRRRVPQDDQTLHNPALREAARSELQTQIGEHEQRCVTDLLALYRFDDKDYEHHAWVLDQGPWRVDPFDTEALKHYGVLAGKTTAAGAVAGAAFDVLTHGLSLGAGTLVGTTLGAGAGGWRGFGRQLRERMSGHESLMVSDATLRLLALRQRHVLQSLASRGHAAQTPIVAAQADEGDWKQGRLPAPLRRARLHPEFSALNPEGAGSAPADKDVLISTLSESLARYNSH